MSNLLVFVRIYPEEFEDDNMAPKDLYKLTLILLFIEILKADMVKVDQFTYSFLFEK